MAWMMRCASSAAKRAPELRHSRFEAVRLRLERFDPGTGWRLWLYEFVLFGFKQAWACLFGGLLLALLLATHFFYPESAALHRYDFLTLSAISIQAAMLAFRLETWAEAKAVCAASTNGSPPLPRRT